MSKDRIYIFDTTLRAGVASARVRSGFAVRGRDHVKPSRNTQTEK